MAFFKVFALAACLSAALAAPAPQTLIHAAQPTLLRAVPQFVTAHGSPVSVRTLASPTLVHQAPALQEVRTISHATHDIASPVAVRTISHATHDIASPVAVRTVSHATPVVQEVRIEEQEEIEVVDANPQYTFGYSVADVVSGDAKTREESRDGDVVRGSYTVADPDGRVRRVEYTADKEHGFQATVTYDGEAGPPAIPIDAPARTTVVAAAAPAAAEEEVILEARDSVNAAPASVQIAQPAFIRASGAQVIAHSAPAVRTISHASVPAVVRSNAAHVVHTAPSVRTVSHAAAIPTVVRADAATHLVHSPAQQVFRLASVPLGARLVHV